MSELYICIDCEVSNDLVDPVSLDAHGMCPRCGSTSVVSTSVFSSLIRKEQAKAVAPMNVGERQRALVAQRAKNNAPVRDYLDSIFYPLAGATNAQCALNEQLGHARTKWDGWAFHVYYPWAQVLDQDDNPVPGHFVLELINGTRNGPRWLIVLDECLHEVREIVP